MSKLNIAVGALITLVSVQAQAAPAPISQTCVLKEFPTYPYVVVVAEIVHSPGYSLQIVDRGKLYDLGGTEKGRRATGNATEVEIELFQTPLQDAPAVKVGDL